VTGLTIPNFITIARLIGVPVVVWLIIADQYFAAVSLFILAGVSDAVDGFIAKRYGATSELGAFLDPIADKALLVSVFVTLGYEGILPAWLIILTVSRDILIIGGVILSYVMAKPVAMKPLWVSKLNTVAQILLIALVLADLAGMAVSTIVVTTLVMAVAGLTIASASAYLVDWVRHMAGGTEGSA
jgi:cardiolipin synthase (CMP-forming)